MRKVISILLMITLLLQAIPVLHLFSSHPEVFYSYIDEDNSNDKSNDIKKSPQAKEFLAHIQLELLPPAIETHPRNTATRLHSEPFFEYDTPPPDRS